MSSVVVVIFQKEAQQAATEFQIFIEKGWVNRFYLPMSEDAFGDFGADETTAPAPVQEAEMDVNVDHPALN